MIGGVFFGGVGGGVAFPTLPTLGTVLGISSFVVGAILSINRFTRLVMATPTGQLLDSVGTRKPRLVGLFVQGLVPFGYVLALDPGPVPLQCGDLLPLAGLLGGLGVRVRRRAPPYPRHDRGKWAGYMRGGQSLDDPEPPRSPEIVPDG